MKRRLLLTNGSHIIRDAGRVSPHLAAPRECSLYRIKYMSPVTHGRTKNGRKDVFLRRKLGQRL